LKCERGGSSCPVARLDLDIPLNGGGSATYFNRGDIHALPRSPQLSQSRDRRIVLKCGKSRQSGQDAQMTRPAYDFRFALIALGALALILSFGGDAAGQTTTSGARRATRSCCSSRVCPMGCCTARPAAASSMAGEGSASVLAQTMGQTRPGSSCECQSDEPVSPASGRESRPAGSRPGEELRAVALVATPHTHPGHVARLIEPDAWPARSPLFFATSRLRI
jgi:hypothetical protein